LGLWKQPPAAVHGPEATANFAKVVGLLVIVGEDVVGECVGATVVGDKVGDEVVGLSVLVGEEVGPAVGEVVGLRVLVGEEVSPGTRYMKFFNPLCVDVAPFAYIVLH